MSFLWCFNISVLYLYCVLYGSSVVLTFILFNFLHKNNMNILVKKGIPPRLASGAKLPHFWNEKLQLHSSSLQLLNSFNSVSSWMTYELNSEISLLQGLLCEQDYSCKVQPNVSERQFNVLLWIPGSWQPIKHPVAICPLDAVGG